MSHGWFGVKAGFHSFPRGCKSAKAFGCVKSENLNTKTESHEKYISEIKQFVSL
jgi:hypothetical protein